MKNKESISKARHDLKNCLTIMKCNLELFDLYKKGKESDQKVKKMIKVINKEIDRMVKIISKI